MIKALNKIVFAGELRRGMVVRPFKGTTYKIPLDSLDWTQTLHSEWWDHIVVGVDEDKVRLARPYAYAMEHFDSNSPLIGCECYSVQKTSDTPYMIQRHEMLT